MDLTRNLIAARDDLNNAVAAASQGDLFAAGAHYRAASDKLEEISVMDTRRFNPSQGI